MQVQPDGAAWTYGPRTFAARDTPYQFRCQLHAGMTRPALRQRQRDDPGAHPVVDAELHADGVADGEPDDVAGWRQPHAGRRRHAGRRLR